MSMPIPVVAAQVGRLALQKGAELVTEKVAPKAGEAVGEAMSALGKKASAAVQQMAHRGGLPGAVLDKLDSGVGRMQAMLSRAPPAFQSLQAEVKNQVSAAAPKIAEQVVSAAAQALVNRSGAPMPAERSPDTKASTTILTKATEQPE
jgi:hypothetical protein